MQIFENDVADVLFQSLLVTEKQIKVVVRERVIKISSVSKKESLLEIKVIVSE